MSWFIESPYPFDGTIIMFCMVINTFRIDQVCCLFLAVLMVFQLQKDLNLLSGDVPGATTTATSVIIGGASGGGGGCCGCSVLVWRWCWMLRLVVGKDRLTGLSGFGVTKDQSITSPA